MHNCVYFATRFLAAKSDLLTHLNSLTLDLILNNPRVSAFHPELTSRLQIILKKKRSLEKHEKRSDQLFQENVLESVRFHWETDSSKNFPSDRAFQVRITDRLNFGGILVLQI